MKLGESWHQARNPSANVHKIEGRSSQAYGDGQLKVWYNYWEGKGAQVWRWWKNADESIVERYYDRKSKQMRVTTSAAEDSPSKLPCPCWEHRD